MGRRSVRDAKLDQLQELVRLLEGRIAKLEPSKARAALEAELEDLQRLAAALAAPIPDGASPGPDPVPPPAGPTRR